MSESTRPLRLDVSMKAKPATKEDERKAKLIDRIKRDMAAKVPMKRIQS